MYNKLQVLRLGDKIRLNKTVMQRSPFLGPQPMSLAKGLVGECTYLKLDKVIKGQIEAYVEFTVDDEVYFHELNSNNIDDVDIIISSFEEETSLEVKSLREEIALLESNNLALHKEIAKLQGQVKTPVVMWHANLTLAKPGIVEFGGDFIILSRVSTIATELHLEYDKYALMVNGHKVGVRSDFQTIAQAQKDLMIEVYKHKEATKCM